MNYYFLLEDEKSLLKVLPHWLRYLGFPCTRVADIKQIVKNNYILQSGQGVTQLITKALFDTIDTLLENPGKIDKLVILIDTEERNREYRLEQIDLKIHEKYDRDKWDFELIIFVCNHCFETWLLGADGLCPEVISQNSDFYEYLCHYHVGRDDPEKMGKPENWDKSLAKYHFRYLHELFRYKQVRFRKSKPEYVQTLEYFTALRKRIRDTNHIPSFRKFIDFLNQESGKGADVMNNKTQQNYLEWKKQDLQDELLKKELLEIEGDEEAINDRFYRDLEFGTGGLRGVLGVGTNRMNIYTVGKATKGFANYLNAKSNSPSVAIAYDSRINSDVFAKHAAAIMAECGVKVYIWRELMPTPSLSFAVRHFGCDGGIVVTASHNPSKYNGYKAYGSDGCQITSEAADAILSAIKDVDVFADVPKADFEAKLAEGMISYIGEDVFDAYLSAVGRESLLGDEVDRSVKIAYTPLYGAGLRCVTEVLARNGFTNVSVVKEQASPNGLFPTCPYPNPEIREALEVGLKVAKEVGADLLLATDPDCDRVGIAVKKGDDFTLLSGNEVGMLLLDYICQRRQALGRMPKNPICVKTIVTIDMVNRIAKDYGVEVIDVLTGFKYIGEQIALLEAKGEEDRYIFGFEESYGYLSGGYVRDKDAVNGSFLIAEMFAYHKSQGKSLLQRMEELYAKYGYCLNTLHSFEFEGESGMLKMNGIMDEVRCNTPMNIAGKSVLEVRDYQASQVTTASGETSEIHLPKSNVLKLMLDGNASVVLRPSGTEPKLKLYVSVSAKDRAMAQEIETQLVGELKSVLG